MAALLFVWGSKKAIADYYHQSFTFDRANLRFEKVAGYDLVTYKDFELSQEISSPQLPVEIVQLVLPQNKEISAITIISTDSEYLDGEYTIYPVQPPAILSKLENEIEFVEPAQDIYSSSELYPQNIVEIAKQGYMAGYNIGSLLIHPLQYISAEKKLIFHHKIEIEISYADTKKAPLPFAKRTDYAETLLKNSIKEIVKNPVDIPEFLPKESMKNSRLPDEEHLYVIITTDDMISSFQPLANWKLKKGLSATIVPTSWIYSEYTGVDQVEQIRNFIIDAYANWGTLWVLLGGDINLIPYRTAFAMVSDAGISSDEDFIPCDLYFADLDGDWNANGNDVYGEVEDDIDMYPDVFVGRASVENASEATAFVDKVLTYEKNPSTDYQLDMLFLAMILWWDPYTDSGVGKDYIDDMFVPSRFDPITKLYQSLGNETYDNVMTALNSGQSIINHDGHAWTNVMGIGDSYLYNSDMLALTNGPAYSILYSIGCWPAAFDYPCIAENFITNPNGGGVAFIGNSRYGWGSPGNPVYGYSDRFDQEFFHQLFDNNIFHIGNTLAAEKSTYVSLAGEENVYRWCEYEINLLGDPEMPIWTDTPQELAVTFPDELPLGESVCQITVTDGNNLVQGALVCIMQDTTVYETAFTGLDGQVSFEITTSDASSDLQLTVTAQNFIPFEGTISLVSTNPYVQISSYLANGSPEGYISPGETVSMDVWFHNFGNEDASDISASISTDNTKITMTDSTETIAGISAGDYILIENAFSFLVSSDVTNGEVIYLNSEISDNADNTWTNLLSITGATPVISYFYHAIVDTTYGNGDGIAQPGETVNPNIILRNEGLALAENVGATLSCDNPYIDIPGYTWEFGDILSSEYSHSLAEVSIDPGCPTPLFPQINISILTDNGYTFTDSFYLTVGEAGFWDDMESGEGDWTHSGTDDLWHLSSNRKFSGDYSWYCGNEDSFVYNDNVEELLVSDPFTACPSAELSFWCWYEFPNYGTDGCYIELSDGSGWTDLDFIGSGGALGTLTTGNDWLEYKYDLSEYEPGTELTLRFRFASSTIMDGGEVAEGVYIDDVKIQSKSEIVSADFYSDVTSGAMPLTVHFFDNSTSVVGEIVSWFWEFGDGETSEEQNPTHTYEIQGKKTVSLTITNEFGFTDTKVKVNYIDVASGGGYVIYVNPDGSGDYTNLKDGAEALYDGDTLLVADAIYTGSNNKNISLEGKSVTICSENGPENCIIDCESSGFAFILGNNNALTCINGFTIRNTHNINKGGAINCENASARIENCIFENCGSEDNGGAIFGSNSPELTIIDCQFVNNWSGSSGGAIQCNNITDVVLNNSSFNGCSTILDGGAIYISDCNSVSLIEDIISDGSAQYGGGIYSICCDSLEMKNLSLISNISSQFGGGVYLGEANARIENCIISDNSATRGAGLYLDESALLTINSRITDNSASLLGGGIYSDGSTLHSVNCTISNNTADSYGGGIFVYGSTVDVENSIFWGDTPQEIYPTSADLTAEYSDIQGGWTGETNIDSDPLLVAGEPFDYRLTLGSPCIDAGYNDFVTTDSDLDGNQRIWDGNDDGVAIVDMGCYEFGAPSVGINPEPETQDAFKLSQNYPNPFSTSTKIPFNLHRRDAKSAEIKIYNIKGQLVKEFKIENSKFEITGKVIWDGTDESGKQLPSGIYLYKLSAGEQSVVKKMLLLR
jgi:PKD repeat protein